MSSHQVGNKCTAGKVHVLCREETNYHPTTQTDLHPIPKARIIPEPIPKQSVCWLWHTWNKGPTCGGMCDVMGCCCCCEEWARVWRNVKTGGAKAGCTGIQGGDGVGEGRGMSQKGKRIPHSLSVTHHMGQCQMLTSNCSKCQASHYS